MTKQVDNGGFKPLSTDIPRRLIWRSWGREKTGKNHLGLTAPGPIYGLYFDPGGLEGVAEKFVTEGKEIHTVQYRFNKKRNDQDDAKELKDRFLADYYEVALKQARTIQIDETELWQVFRFAEWGRESAKGREYGPLNGEYRGLIQAAYDAGINLQLIQKVREVWEDDKPTGKMGPDGFKQAGNIVQVNLEHSWERPEEGDFAEGFKVTVKECRQNMAIAGDTYSNIDFKTLGLYVFPDSTEDSWE